MIGRLVGSLPAFACHDVFGVPLRPLVLRRGRFVLTMARLGFSQQLPHRRDVDAAESSSRKPRGDLLKQPAVAVRIVEGREREIGATFRVAAGRVSAGPYVQKVALKVEHFADVDAASNQLCACGLEVVDDKERALNRSWYGSREPLPIMIEHGDPGGVSCTRRHSSP